MTNLRLKAAAMLWVPLLCFSCIQDEPLNPEADILTFSLPAAVSLAEASFNQGDISVTVRKGADVSSVAPLIKITAGAVIEPAADVPQDFNRPVIYTVTAADGVHRRVYTVHTLSHSLYYYDFERWETLNPPFRYETPVEFGADGQRAVYWDSSNKGIALYQQFTDAALFPIHKTDKSAAGACGAEMITGKGPGKIFSRNIPVAAGSLFAGVMNPENALKDPLLATRFGQPCLEKPLRFRGYYNYKPGTGEYITPDGIAPNRRDSCTINAVLFRVDAGVQLLDGTNILTHPNIIALALLPEKDRAGTAGDEYVPFDIPFEYRSNEPLDFEKNRYKLAVVFSSSFKGDLYEGVIGSRLRVDNVEIITGENE